MKTIAKLTVQAILTYENAPQDFYNVNVMVPLALPPMATSNDIEVDVLEQIIASVAGDLDSGEPNGQGDLSELVKISLCYSLPDPISFDLSEIVSHLTRNGAKYYFQPNQRDFVETELMRRIDGLASKTAAYA